VWIEFKPADPGDRDHFATATEAICQFAEPVNALLGRQAI
jgi:hypothetical protein